VERLTPERAQSLLARAGDLRVLVVGDLMLDRYLTGPAERISPEAPVPVVRVEHESVGVGGAANVAANVTALGCGAEVVGCVGEDAGGQAITEALRDLGVVTRGVVQVAGRPTTEKTRVLALRQQVVRIDREVESEIPEAGARAIVEAIRIAAAEADAVVLEDYDKGVLVSEVIRAALEGAAARDLPVVVDPKRRSFFTFPGATVFKPNKKELEDALGQSVRPDDDEWMEETRRRLGCRALLVTLGDEGMALRSEAGVHLRVPAVARAVYDVSGAGDTVTAVLAIALAAGATLEEAAVLANHAAAVEVAKSGVATVSPQEVLTNVALHFATPS